MRFKILSVLFVFVLIFMIAAVGDDSLNPAKEMTITGTGFERMVDIEKRYTERQLIEIFKNRNSRLAQWFRTGEFCKMGEYFGEEGVIRPEEGEPVHGATKIETYFRDLKKDVSNIRFTTHYVVITEITEELMKPREKWSSKDIIDSIEEHMKYSFNSPGGGSGEAMGGHIRECFGD